MTRAHFMSIAQSLREIKSPAKRRAETDRWIPKLRAENPRFDESRFRAAVEQGAARHGNRRRHHGRRNARTGRFTRAR
jgi:hypothetical protein